MPRRKTTAGGTGLAERQGLSSPGQLVWEGAPPGRISYRLFQTATGAWAMYRDERGVGGHVATIELGPQSDPDLFEMFQAYLLTHPPVALSQRSIRADAGTSINNGVVRRGRGRAMQNQVSVDRSAIGVQ